MEFGRRKFWLAVTVGLWAGLSVFASQSAEQLSVEKVWARALPPVVTTAAAYLRINNAGAGARTLTGASSEAAERVEIHAHDMSADGMMRMRHVKSVEVPSHGAVEFKPHGLHLMFINVKTAFEEGARIPLTLRFDGGQVLTTVVSVSRQPPP
jgi:periplasmic copper chaperone A